MILLTFALIFALARCLAAAPFAPGLSATLPITRRYLNPLSKRQNSGVAGLGDNQDNEYSVQVTIGSDTIPVILDTGSSDLWSISTDCSSSSCGDLQGTPQISATSLKASGVGIELDYGDSTHPTSASGLIFSGPASVGGLKMSDQFIAAVNTTDTALNQQQISGIFGVGFPNPSSSVIISQLLGSSFSSSSSNPLPTGGATVTDAYISALPAQGPLMSRLVTSGQLAQPMFTVTLQRETVEVGGNLGQLTIGQLPDGVSNSSLTWVPVRLYTEAQGGLAGPSNSPQEVYPTRWEVPLDDVQLNGQTLPKPTLSDNIGYSALIDSGTSFLAGPQNVVSTIFSSISPDSNAASDAAPGSGSTPSIPCTTPVELTFVIGGKPFPVDPRDFLGQQTVAADCTVGSLLPTDAPDVGSLMSWILGDPFMKSNLVAFYYGNLTHPSVDPPRMGFLSTVPSNAKDLYGADVKAANNDGEFVATSVAAPTGTPAVASTNSAGVAQATASGSKSGGSGKNGAAQVRARAPWPWVVALVLACCAS